MGWNHQPEKACNNYTTCDMCFLLFGRFLRKLFGNIHTSDIFWSLILTCFPGSLCLQENLRMKQVLRPASLVLLVLLPRSKAPLAALFVLQGSLEVEDISHVGWVPPPQKKTRINPILCLSPPWKPGDLAKSPVIWGDSVTGSVALFLRRKSHWFC